MRFILSALSKDLLQRKTASAYEKVYKIYIIQKQSRKPVLRNRYSEICSQNPWKIPRKNSFLVKLLPKSLQLYKNEVLYKFFSRLLTANLTWSLSEQLSLRTSFFPEHLWLLPIIIHIVIVRFWCFKTSGTKNKLLMLLIFYQAMFPLYSNHPRI